MFKTYEEVSKVYNMKTNNQMKRNGPKMKGWREGALWWNCSVYSLWWWSHKSTHVIKMHRTKYTHISACSVQLLHCVRLFATPWTAVLQASLSISNSQSLLKLMSIELVMSSNSLILCHLLLLLPSIFPSIRVFSNESVLHIRWPKYWSFSFSISPSNEYSGLVSYRMDWLYLLAVQGTPKSLL